MNWNIDPSHTINDDNDDMASTDFEKFKKKYMLQVMTYDHHWWKPMVNAQIW